MDGESCRERMPGNRTASIDRTGDRRDIPHPDRVIFPGGNLGALEKIGFKKKKKVRAVYQIEKGFTHYATRDV